MSAMTQSAFDYAALPADIALETRAAAERVKLRLKRSVEDIIEIGRELTAVKDKLPHGKFLIWVNAEFEMSKDTAQNFMAVFERFGENGNFPNFKPSVLYALSAPSTPEQVVSQALEKAESGEKVTVACRYGSSDVKNSARNPTGGGSVFIEPPAAGIAG